MSKNEFEMDSYNTGPSHSQCIVLNHTLTGCGEIDICDKLRDAIKERNTHGVGTSIINTIGSHNILNTVAGPNAAAFLLKNGGIIRVALQTVTIEPPSENRQSNAPPHSQNSCPVANSMARSQLLSGSAKFRRVMLSGTLRRSERGVIIDRGRPMLPASSVPEDLIAQAQVVLQGKSREMIVRELQRTNLNVNEAVNNLLSRDDDDDDQDDDVMLPEELLSLLDPSHPGSLLDAEVYGGDAFEYLGRGAGIGDRRKTEREKESKKAKDKGADGSKTVLDLGEDIEYWTGQAESPVPQEIEGFKDIVATSSELLAISKCNRLFAWRWDEGKGESTQHLTLSQSLAENEKVLAVAASRLRIAVYTSEGNVISWLDPNAVGQRAYKATMACHKYGGSSGVEPYLAVSDQLCVVWDNNGHFSWMGNYPASEKSKQWEKDRSKPRKHVTFDTQTTGETITEGIEVRTRAAPLYSPGSVALNISGVRPVIGVLQETAWTLSEMCRFRILEPSVYDSDFPVDTKVNEEECKPIIGKKRRAISELFAPQSSPREEPWTISDVIWIHEQHMNDIAVVRIVDGSMLGVEYTTPQQSMLFATDQSATLLSEYSTPAGKMRILRKDEVCVVTPKMKSSRTPKVLQHELLPFRLSGSPKTVLSVVADLCGIRCLVEKRGRVYVVRASVLGKVLSEHLVPVYPPSVGDVNNKPQLVNYGEDSILVLRDGRGNLMPLGRDAVMSFREPIILHAPAVKSFSIFVQPQNSENAAGGKISRRATVMLVSGPGEKASTQGLPSLLQAVLYCDVQSVQNILEMYSALPEDDVTLLDEVVNVRSDGDANIIHTAVRLAVARKNKHDADPVEKEKTEKDCEKDATGQWAVADVRDQRRAFEHRWQRLLRSSWADRNEERQQLFPSQDAPAPPAAVDAPPDSGEALENAIAVMDPPVEHTVEISKYGTAVADETSRQAAALRIVDVVLSHPKLQKHLEQLLAHRDSTGLTPLQAAINIRSYGAALHIWSAIKECVAQKCEQERKAVMRKLLLPVRSRPDDSPIFLLCYNDTCSFTWTGEEHINQDIFECRTCGLTGTLCCCTECAFTCHRNHDCKLKRTSPTAYCDCWEKCPCNALVAGNQRKREQLFVELLEHSDLFELTNNRGEHVMLFLARTLGRQQQEQSNYTKRRRPTHNTDTPNNLPEHDLEPPRFTSFALDACVERWSIVKSLIMIGVRNLANDQRVPEEMLVLKSQSGSTHLDKFMFSFLAKCPDTLCDKLFSCIVREAKESPDSTKCIGRLARSVIRVYTHCVLALPVAAATAVSHKNKHTPSGDRRSIQTITLSGFFSIVRKEQNNKETKQNAISSLILRCQSVLLRLGAVAVHEVAQTADAVLSLVRMGVLKPTVPVLSSSGHDSLESVERFLNGETDFSTALRREDGEKEKRKRRHSTRRNTDRNEGEENEDREREESDDSDSEGEVHSSRRVNSQSGPEDTTMDDTFEHVAVSSQRRNAVSEGPGSEGDDSDDMEETDLESTDDGDDEEREGHVMVEEDDNSDEEDTEDERDGDGNGDNENEVDAEGEGEVETEGEEQPAAFEADDSRRTDEQSEYSGRSPDYGRVHGIQNDEEFRMEQDTNREAVGNVAAAEGVQDVVDLTSPPPAEEAPPVIVNDGNAQLSANDEESTRDARQSEGSSANNAEAIVSTDGTAFNQDGEGGEHRRTSSSSSRLAFRSQAASRRQRGSESLSRVRDAGERLSRVIMQRVVRDRIRDTTAPVTADTTRAASPSSTKKRSVKFDDPVASTHQTSQLLSMSFAFLVRLLDDLLSKLACDQVSETSVSCQEQDLSDIISRVGRKMAASWQWMQTVLDRMEAQLKYGNSIVAAGLSEKKKDKKRDKKEKDRKEKASAEESLPSRKETFEYVMYILRAQSAEAGDEFPVVDVEMLSFLVYVFDAYLSFRETMDMIIQMESNRTIQQLMCVEEDEEAVESGVESIPKPQKLSNRTVAQFFQRSNSMCYSRAAGDGAWDTMRSQNIPLVDRPSVLTPDADRDTMLAPPVKETTWQEYKNMAESLGVGNASCQSLSERAEAEMNEGPWCIPLAGTATSDQQEAQPEETMECDDMKKSVAPEGMEELSLESVRREMKEVMQTPLNVAMARWKNVLQLMAGQCHDQLLAAYGGEMGGSHVLSTLARFAVRQSEFRKRMDTYRGQQTRDLTIEVTREHAQLVRDTTFQLNQTYVRRVNTPKLRDCKEGDPPPLATARVKIRFQGEPGEGTGVARSFYTAFAEALVALKQLPFQELGWSGGDDFLFGGSHNAPSTPPAQGGQLSSSADRGNRRIQLIRERGSSSIIGRKRPVKRFPLSISSAPFIVQDIAETERRVRERDAIPIASHRDELAKDSQPICEALFVKVRAIREAAASRITGMLCDVPNSVATQILSNHETLKSYVEDAVMLMLSTSLPTDLALLAVNHETNTYSNSSVGPPAATDPATLFCRSRRGGWTLVAGNRSPIRINAFRNVGRMIGICLSQGEMFPLRFARHVFKWILDRPVNWLDLQFLDPQMFESLRSLLSEENDAAFFEAMTLSFVVDLPLDGPDMPAKELELIPGGKDVAVTRENVVEYVYRLVETLMLGVHLPCLNAMKQGVYDVIPSGSLAGLTAEDLRLILCGTEMVNIGQLEALTTFSDESRATVESLDRFKRWFWDVVDQFSAQEKQDLVFFWTGTPSLPPAQEQWQPPPTVMVRPQDEQFLPTANTCINRIYVPLYSSKKLLRAKLQLAIKARNFGFV